MSRRQHRPTARPTSPPRALPASNGGAEVSRREHSELAAVQSDGAKSILRLLAEPKFKKAISTRLGQLFGADEMIAMVSTCLQQSPLLARCDPMTVLGAVVECSQVGLRLDRALGQAYLVPFKNGRRSYASGHDVYEAQLILGYRGMITLAHNAGAVTNVRAKIVYEADFFDYEEGLVPKLIHRPNDTRDRGNPVYVYSVVDKAGGVSSAYVMPWWKIEDIRDAQVKRGNTIWQTHTEEMGLKTPIRRGLKYHPLAPRQQRVMQLDELAEEGVEQELGMIGAQAMDEIAESSELSGQAREQASIEASVAASTTLADRATSEEPTPASSASSSADEGGLLSAAEEAAFEAAQRKGGA